MKKLSLIAMLLLSACGCDAADTECIKHQAAEDAVYCVPEAVSTSPDGTTLYRVSSRCSKIHDGHDVYFSKSGTQTTELCGKGCSRPVTTPNENGEK